MVGENVARPFVKWAGGKGQLLPILKSFYPKGLGQEINKYAEPFVGGGAVLFSIIQEYKFKEVFISDINRELINTYCVIRDNPFLLIELLREFQNKYLSLTIEEQKDYFYEKRTLFNLKKEKNEIDEEEAALFIFLNRTCFNGLYRVNAKGGFNVPIGRYLNPTICDNENILAASDVLKGVNIVFGGYKESRDYIDEHTFAYFDPPYRPLSITSFFTSYSKDSFNDEDQKELALYLYELSEKGAFVMESNSDPHNVDEKDNFFDDMFDKMILRRIVAPRHISSNASSRGNIGEILVTNY